MATPGWFAEVPALDAIGPTLRIQAVDTPWHRSSVAIVTGTRGTAVVKAWDEAAHARCRAEMSALHRLAGRDSLAPRAMRIGGRADPYPLSDGRVLTAQSYISGLTADREFRRATRRTPLLQAAGGRLAQLHTAMGPPSREWSSRLLGLSSFATRVATPLTGLVAHGVALLERSLDHLLTLPTAMIHGDPTFGNMIIGPASLSFVDFEFCRVDLRILDLGVLWAAHRDESGTFQGLDQADLGVAVRAYAQQSPLTIDELRLLPLASLGFLLLVATDLIAAGSTSFFGLPRILSAALSQAEAAQRPAR